MRTIFAEYNPQRNSIDIYTNVGYMLRIDCWEAEKDLKTTPGSDCALTGCVRSVKDCSKCIGFTLFLYFTIYKSLLLFSQ